MVQSLSDTVAVPDGTQDKGRLPFRVRIGVTGHRYLRDEPAVALRVAERMGELREMFPPTDVTPVTFTILTSLAEGADRLVPRVARETLTGVRVASEVVLPLDVEDYLDDFEGDPSRMEFQDMLAGAERRTQLATEPKLSGDARKLAYQRAGRYIVDRSDVVVAVWDGRESRGLGGTADIVEYARRQLVPLLVIPAGSVGSVGEGRAEPEFPLSVPRWLDTLDSYRQLESYNQPRIKAKQFAVQLDSAHARLRGPAQELSSHREFERLARWAVADYVRADLLAIRHQSQYALLGRAIHFLAAFAVTAVAVEAVFGRNSSVWLIVEITLLSALICAVAFGRRGRLRERWIACRSLAEGFRSAIFMAMTGAAEGTHTDTGGPWFQRAFSEVWSERPRIEFRESEADRLRRFLIRAWIDDQISFHQHSAERHSDLQARYTWTVYTLATVTITIAALHIAGVPHPEGWHNAFTFLAITLPGFGAAVTGLRERGHHRLHEERSRRTAERLQRLKSRPDPDPDLSSVRALAAEAQRIMVEERGEWSGVIEFEELEMVI